MSYGKPGNLTESQFSSVMNTSRRVAAAVAREEAQAILNSNLDLERQVQALRKVIEDMGTQIQGLRFVNVDLGYFKVEPMEPGYSQEPHRQIYPIQCQWTPPKDGDKTTVQGEEFTFFRGQWRRRSEMEAFASAKQFL